MTATGHPARHDFIREMAEEIRTQNAFNKPKIHTDFPIGKSWVQSFLKRHPHLHTTLSRSIEAACIKDVTKEIVLKFFEKLEMTLKEFHIALENVYNIDETGIILII